MKRTITMILATAAVATTMACSGANASAKKEDPTANADYHYKLASGYFHADRREEKARQVHLARMELEQALTYDSEHVPSHYLLGFILMGRRQYAEAIVHFKEVLRLEPSYHDATNNLGVIYLAQERWED
ncbi:MAG: tetratricopeptide repeat protein, partial [Myxococcota bacterium]